MRGLLGTFRSAESQPEIATLAALLACLQFGNVRTCAGVKHRQDPAEGGEEGEAGGEAVQQSTEAAKEAGQRAQRKGSRASSGELEEEASAPLLGQEQVQWKWGQGEHTAQSTSMSQHDRQNASGWAAAGAGIRMVLLAVGEGDLPVAHIYTHKVWNLSRGGSSASHPTSNSHTGPQNLRIVQQAKPVRLCQLVMAGRRRAVLDPLPKDSDFHGTPELLSRSWSSKPAQQDSHRPWTAGPVAEQVKLMGPCQLVTARQVVPGQLRVTTLQLRFLGDPPLEEGPTKPKARTRLHDALLDCRLFHAPWGIPPTEEGPPQAQGTHRLA